MMDELIAPLRNRIERIGWTETARRSGLRRESLHRALGRNRTVDPSFSTIVRVAKAVGLKLSIR